MNLEATAHHEAGHAVIGCVVGLDIGPITVVACDEYDGFCPAAWDPNDVESVRAGLLFLLAGGFADAKYRGVKWDCFEHDSEPSHGEHHDLGNFAVELERYARLKGVSARAAEPLLFQEAEQLVEQHFAEIQQLA